MFQVMASNGSGEPELNISVNSEEEPDVHFEPVVTLPEVEVSTNEENEEELIKLRAKLYRFDTTDDEASQWKERGTGMVKILRHTETNTCRVVMRRDKTFKICANHFITPWMTLKPSCGSNRAWVWTVQADFADETLKTECLAIRFANADIANQWKNKFEEAQKIVVEKCDLYKNNPAYDSTTESQSSLSELENDSSLDKDASQEKLNSSVDKKCENEDKQEDKKEDIAKDVTEQIASLDVK